MDPQPEDDRTLIRPVMPAPAPASGYEPTQLSPAPGAPAAPSDEATRIVTPHPAAPPAPAAPPPPALHDDDSGTLAVGTKLGEFELTGVLGVGGFGIVYLAQDHSLHRRVALKEYMPSALAMRKGGTQVSVKSERHRETFEAGLKSFVNEARLLAQFDHPSLVKVYRFWEANGTAYMVMPYYEGITLKERLRELGAPPDEAWLRALLAPLTEALAVIHAENCFHRDIAPDNIILLAGSGRPLLLDFGAARRVIGDMTQALTVILKPGYAPLEQYAEVPHMKQGPWTDVYALAAVVYFAITGKTPPVSVGRIVGDNYQPLAETAAGRYSAGFLEAVDHALKVKPEERIPSIDAFRAEMGLGPVASAPATTLMPRTAAAGPAGAAGGAAATTPLAADRRLWIAIGAAVLVLGGGAYFALRPGAPKQAPAPATLTQAPATPAPTAQPAVPPAAPPATPPAPASPAPFTIAGEFDRVLKDHTPGFSVIASAPRPQLRIGQDRLKFDVTSSREGYVYVLVLGPDGSLMRLIPNTNARNNRIAAGQTLTLPPPSSPIETSEPTGREDFLVIVSATPRSYDKLGGTEQYSFLFLPEVDRLAALAAAAGAGPSILLGAPSPSCQGDDCQAYGAARFAVDVVR
jgi:hypothetical protein